MTTEELEESTHEVWPAKEEETEERLISVEAVKSTDDYYYLKKN